MDFSKVKSVAIYPAIGIARVGNSRKGYFIGPTIPGQHPVDPDDFRDDEGNIKRQGAKFFIYGLDANGKVLGEINASDGAEINWRVDVANKKAAWYNFHLAFDIPAAQGYYDEDGNAVPHAPGPPLLSQFRNLKYGTKEEDRKNLMIEPTARRIKGINVNQDGGKYALDDGEINGEPVYLGELRTDEAGRLIFLGGYGHSASFDNSPLTTFANNEGWYDDTSDGPVDATVTLPDGRSFDALGAWVVTAPTNFAVGVQAFSTGYDLIVNTMAELHDSFKVETPLFYRDIFPMFKQLSINQWVNAGVSRDFGWGSAFDADSEYLLQRLIDGSKANRPFRQTVLESFRNPDFKEMEPLAWPPLYGDGNTFNINSTDPRNWFAITRRQYACLVEWAKGNFIVDQPPKPKKWAEMSPEEQAHGLTEAALEETLGGPFHPGCEFTWPMRIPRLYDSENAFRIKRRKKAEDDFGIALNYEIATGPDGPLDGSSAGDITKWMAVPWQSDTSSCLSAYRTYSGEYLPTFWPARVPNDVLTEKDFHIIQSEHHDTEEKITAFSPAARKKWLRGYIFHNDGSFIGGASIKERIKGVTKFVNEWFKIGILVKKESQADSELFPKSIWVETGRHKDLDQEVKTRGLSKLPGDKEGTMRPKWVDVNPRKLR
jgi:hypothetical protein